MAFFHGNKTSATLALGAAAVAALCVSTSVWAQSAATGPFPLAAPGNGILIGSSADGVIPPGAIPLDGLPPGAVPLQQGFTPNGSVPPGTLIRVASDGQIPAGAVEVGQLPNGVIPVGGGQAPVISGPAPLATAQALPRPAAVPNGGLSNRGIRESVAPAGTAEERVFYSGDVQPNYTGGYTQQVVSGTGQPGGYIERRVVNGVQQVAVPVYRPGGYAAQAQYAQQQYAQQLYAQQLYAQPNYVPHQYPAYQYVQAPVRAPGWIQPRPTPRPAPVEQTAQDQPPIRIVNNNYNTIRVVTSANSTATAPKSGYPMMAYATAPVNLRSCPSVGCKRIATIPTGRALKLTGCKARWCSAVIGKRKCWVSRKYVGVRR